VPDHEIHSVDGEIIGTPLDAEYYNSLGTSTTAKRGAVQTRCLHAWGENRIIARMMSILLLLPLAGLLAVSAWVWRDATRRNMNPRWGIAVGLVLIVFLPPYLLIRQPVRCSLCGKAIPASDSLCDECEQPAGKDDAGRPGYIFG